MRQDVPDLLNWTVAGGVIARIVDDDVNMAINLYSFLGSLLNNFIGRIEV